MHLLPAIWFTVIAGFSECLHLHTAEAFSEFSFLTEPVDTVVIRNRPVILHCAVHYQATGGQGGVATVSETSPSRLSAVNIQWLRDSTSIVTSSSSNRQILANGSLYMDHSVAERGWYQCRANLTGVGVLLSRKALLRPAYIDSTFTEEPNSTTAYLGDAVMFACLIGGVPQPAIQWIKDDTDIVSDLSNFVFHAEGSILELRNVQFTDFGRYRCRASNVDRSKTSGVAILAQNSDATTYQGVLPRFVMQPSDLVIVEGATAEFCCAANGRDRNGNRPKVVWLKDGIAVDVVNQDGRFSIMGESSLRIDAVIEDDVGTYTCRAANLEDSIDAHATLKVLVPPKLRQRPRNSLVLVNSDKDLTCDVYSNPPPTIQWVKDGSPIIPDDYIQIINSRVLRILGVLPSDGGMYQCFASANEAGSVQASAQLVFQNNVVSTSSVGVPSSPLDLTAPIISMNFLTLAWRPPDESGHSDIVNYSIWWQEKDNARQREMNVTAMEANIQHLKSSTVYAFHVHAVNSHGYSSKPAGLLIPTQAEAPVPDVPTNLVAIATSPTTIQVTWDPPQRGAAVVTYRVYYYDIGAASPTESELNVTQGTVCQLINLKKFHQYSIRVVGINLNGMGTSTLEVNCRTYSDGTLKVESLVPSAQPLNVSVEALSSTSVLVGWDPPPEDTQNGVITGYKIRYRLSKDRQYMTATADGGRTRHSLTDLTPGTEYSVSVRAMTVNGTGPQTIWVSTETFTNDLDESNVPGEPTSLRVRPLTNSIVVSWTPPTTADSVMIRGYILGYGIGVPDVYRQILDAKQRYHTIKGLLPSSEYVISLKAFNHAGHGRPKYETTITREEPTPETQTPIMPPVGLKATVLSATTIVLTWIDSTLGRSQRVTDNRLYTVRYQPRGGSGSGPALSRKPKLVNTTNLNIHIEELKPDTEYEFSVKVVKARRQSAWSLSVFNKTKEMVPASSVRDLTPISLDGRPTWISLNWQPPRQTNGQITGYLVFYTTDSTQKDRDWVVEDVRGDRLSTTVKDLSPETTYYFKVQARNSVGYGPSSPTVIFRTPRLDGTGGGLIDMPDDYGRPGMTRPGGKVSMDSGLGDTASATAVAIGWGISSLMLWIIIGVIGGLTVIAVIIVTTILCQRWIKSKQTSRQHPSSGGYQPANKMKQVAVTELQPPDLWINYDRARVGNRDKCDDPDEETAMMTNSSDCRDDVDSVDIANLDRYRRVRHCPKPVMIPVDQPPLPRETSSQVVYPRVPQSGVPASQFAGVPRVNAGDLMTSGRPYYTGDTGGGPGIENCRTPPTAPTLSPSPYTQISNDLDHTDETTDDNTDLSTEKNPKTLSTEELSAEMANLDGLMKDLSAITQLQQEFEL